MTIDTAFTHFPSLNTNRLHLRQIQPTDAEALFVIKSDLKVIKFSGSEPHYTLKDTYMLIHQLLSLYSQRKVLFWAITLKDVNTVIGSCTFWNFGPDFHYAEIGYELHQAYWRQSIISEAISAILTYGFIELGLHRVEANVDLRNRPSENLLLKLGFTYEGNLRQRFFFRDHFEDEHYFGLLKDEWLKSA